MKRLWSIILVGIAASTGWAAQTAGLLLVDVSAATASGSGVGGKVTSWGNAGTLNGAFVPTGAGPEYQVLGGAPALYFDGTGETALAGPATPVELTGGNSWTIEAWLHKTHFKGNEEIFLAWTLREVVSPPHDRMLEARYSINKDIAIEHYGGNNLPWGAQLPALDEWHHVVVTRDAVSNVETLFVDGRMVVTGVRSTVDIVPGGDITIGATWNSNRSGFWGGFVGYIGQMRVHSGALPMGGVVQNYLDERATYGRTSDPDSVWVGSSSSTLPWETAAHWQGGTKPALSGSAASILNGNVAGLTSDAGVLDQINFTHGGLEMSGGARLAIKPDQVVHVGRGAGNVFSLDVEQGYLNVPGIQEGWLLLGTEGGRLAH